MDYPQESHTWTIRDQPTIKRLNKATESDAIDSIVFEMHNLKWYLRFRPNGLASHQHVGNAFLILYLTGLPPNRSSINFRYKFSLLETNTIYQQTTTFKSGFMNISWDKAVLFTKQIKNLKQFTLNVTIELLAIYDEQGIDVLNEYHINDEYDEINKEHEEVLKENKKLRKKGLRRITSNSPKMVKRLSIKSPKLSSRSPKSSSRSPKKSVIGSYDVVAYNSRLDTLEQEMIKLNGVITDLAQSVKKMERKLITEQKNDIFDVKHDHYAIVMQEVNYMKRAIAKLAENENKNKDKELSLEQKRLKTWFMSKVRLPQYFDVFMENDIVDLEVVYRIGKDELKDMGINKVGHQMRILQEIENLITNKHEDEDKKVNMNVDNKDGNKDRNRLDTLNDTDKIRHIVDTDDDEDLLSLDGNNGCRIIGMSAKMSDSDDLYRKIETRDGSIIVGDVAGDIAGNIEGNLEKETIETPQ